MILIPESELYVVKLHGQLGNAGYKGGKVSFNKEASVVDCIVRDESEGGARLQFESHFDCPRFIILRISGGQAIICEVRQFAHNIMGVMFLG